MHPVIFGIALSIKLVTPVSDQVPKLNVEATCNASVAADKAMDLALPQSYEKCMADENSAQQALRPIWSSYSATVQASCHGEAVAGGNESYVDLLVCVQMTDGLEAKRVTGLRGASRKKPAN